jgi:hypothetical protein
MGWLLGYDTSHYQPPAPGLAAECSRGRFQIIKASEGQRMRDWTMDGHRQLFADRPRAPYHFLDFSGANGEARNFLGATAGRHWEMPHILDAEKGSAGSKRATRDYLFQMLDIIGGAIGEAPMIYTGPGWWVPTVEPDPRFALHPLWIARYPSAFTNGNPPPDNATVPSVAPWPTWTVWQYSDAGGLDRNVCSSEALARLTGTNPQPVPPAPPAPPVLTPEQLEEQELMTAKDDINNYTNVMVQNAINKIGDMLGTTPGQPTIAQRIAAVGPFVADCGTDGTWVVGGAGRYQIPHGETLASLTFIGALPAPVPMRLVQIADVRIVAAGK